MKKFNPTKQPKAAKTSPPIAPVNTEYDIQNSNNSTNSLSISTLELVAVAPAPRVQTARSLPEQLIMVAT